MAITIFRYIDDTGSQFCHVIRTESPFIKGPFSKSLIEDICRLGKISKKVRLTRIIQIYMYLTFPMPSIHLKYLNRR